MRAGARQHDAWPLALVGITALGIALGVAYSLITEPPGPVGDPGFYHETARALADGHGYVGSHTLGTAGATAEHPPLYSLLVAGIDLLGGRSEGAQRLVASIVCGAAF